MPQGIGERVQLRRCPLSRPGAATIPALPTHRHTDLAKSLAEPPGARHAVAVVIRILLLGTGLLILTWAAMAILARRLPPGAAKDLASVLPACATTVRRLWRDPRVPLRARIALGLAALWVLSPVDLIPEFLPVIGPLDDVIVVALALRYAARQVPRPVLAEAWPGETRMLDRLLPVRNDG